MFTGSVSCFVSVLYKFPDFLIGLCGALLVLSSQKA